MFILINKGNIFDGTFDQFEDCFFSFNEGSSLEEKQRAILNWAYSNNYECEFVTKKSLYDSDGSYTGQAREIDHLHSEMVIDLFKKFTTLGYGVREISHVLMSHIPLLESRFILDMRKEVKNTITLSVDKIKDYEQGMCAGDTAFRIGGKMLYYQSADVIMKRNGIGCSPVDAASRVVSKTDNEYTTALGYIEGYTSAERSCKQK